MLPRPGQRSGKQSRGRVSNPEVGQAIQRSGKLFGGQASYPEVRQGDFQPGEARQRRQDRGLKIQSDKST